MNAQSGGSRDDGFTILEVVVSLALLAFVMTAMASMFYSAANVAVDTKSRTQAAGLAVKALESMRVSAYAKVGFFSSQPGYSVNCDPTDAFAETVTLGTGNPATARYKPQETGVRLPGSGLDFTITKCIVWADVPRLAGGPIEDAYKKTMVDVSWADRTGAVHHVRQNSVVYPGGFGSYAGPRTNPAGSEGGQAGGTVVSPSAPFNVVVTPPPDPSPDTTPTRSLDVVWEYTGVDVHHFEVQWAEDSSFATILGQEDTSDGFERSHTVGNLAPFWTYWVRVIAYADALETAASPASTAVQQTTTPYAASGCNVGPLTITTTGTPPSSAKVYLANNGRLNVDLTLTVTFAGPCVAAYDVRATGPSPAATQVGLWALPGSGSSRTTTASVASQSWAPGVYTFAVRANTVATGSSRTFLICANTTTPNPNPNAC